MCTRTFTYQSLLYAVMAKGYAPFLCQLFSNSKSLYYVSNTVANRHFGMNRVILNSINKLSEMSTNVDVIVYFMGGGGKRVLKKRGLFLVVIFHGF